MNRLLIYYKYPKSVKKDNLVRILSVLVFQTYFYQVTLIVVQKGQSGHVAQIFFNKNQISAKNPPKLKM